MEYGVEGFMKDMVIDLGAEDTDVIANLRKTPSSALGSCRHKVKDEDFPVILEKFKKFNIGYFFLIGGNDTMDTIHRVEEYCQSVGYNLKGIGLPKTVDNDLFGTDHTPGFASAARYIALSVQQAGRLGYDMQKVDKFSVFQTVGREAGWLAAASVLAKKEEHDAPHLIYMPERKINKEKMIADAKACIEKYGYCYIVCGEGVLFEDGTPVSASMTKDKFANVEFGAMGGSSAALNIHRILADATGYRGEFQITESLPMCAIDRASKQDLEEAYACGAKAVELAEAGTSGVMVSIVRKSTEPYSYELGTSPLTDVAVRAKPMDDKYINEEGNYVTEEFIKYAKPLIGDFEDFSRLKKVRFEG